MGECEAAEQRLAATGAREKHEPDTIRAAVDATRASLSTLNLRAAEISDGGTHSLPIALVALNDSGFRAASDASPIATARVTDDDALLSDGDIVVGAGTCTGAGADASSAWSLWDGAAAASSDDGAAAADGSGATNDSDFACVAAVSVVSVAAAADADAVRERFAGGGGGCAADGGARDPSPRMMVKLAASRADGGSMKNEPPAPRPSTDGISDAALGADLPSRPLCRYAQKDAHSAPPFASL